MGTVPRIIPAGPLGHYAGRRLRALVPHGVGLSWSTPVRQRDRDDHRHVRQRHPRGFARISPARRRRARSRCCRPSSSPTSATWRSPIRRAWPRRATRSSAIRSEASTLTARGNLVGVVTNGTAVLGLGAIGPLAAKPVMEGKAVLFKKFAGLDCFDIEINERDPGQAGRHDRRARAHVRRHQPRGHQGARVLLHRAQVPRADEDPGVPRRPARHGDHRRRRGAERAARRRQGPATRSSSCARAPAPRRSRASICCVALGIRRENICVADIKGVVYEGRTSRWTTTRRATRSRRTARTLAEILPGADIFLGLSAARVLKPEWLATMAQTPLILALANPEPEIMPDIAKAARPDAIIATGPLGLSEPGEQRPVLPVHLPRRARRRRHDDQRGDEARVRARDRRPRDGRAVGHRRARLRHREPALRPRVPDPEAVRPAPHRA